jgi:hypothetical protein
MKIIHIIERTIDNMEILRECTEMLINNLPHQFPANQTFWLAGGDLKGLPALIAKYKNTPYEKTINSIKFIGFGFRNTEALVGTGTLGAFRAKPELLVLINVSAFMNSAEAIPVGTVLNHYRNDLPIKSLRAIILHELRHVFQSFEYEKYYYNLGSKNDVPYKRNPVEIDAAWNHHLQDYDVSQYPNANAYADAVMGSFASYKSLSPEWQNHYRRKTIRYWMEATRQPNTDALSQPAPQRLVQNRERTKQWLLPTIGKIAGHDYDLRTLPGYDQQSRMFFLSNRVIQATSGMIANDKVVQPTAAPILFLVLSLVTPPDKVPEVVKHLRGVQRITPQEAIANANASFTGGFDANALKRQIMSVFGNR